MLKYALRKISGYGTREKSKLANEYDENEFIDIKKKIKKMPISNGSSIFFKQNVKIGIICDEMMYKNYEPTANLIYITPENWEEELKKCDIFLYIVTWNGLNDQWNKISIQKKYLKKIVKVCDESEIKTIFYSKEDPVYFKKFKNLSKDFKYIFTSEEKMIIKYKKLNPNAVINTLEFAINPLVYNPIGMKKFNSEKLIFSGSWYDNLSERCSDMERIFDENINNLVIVDRAFNEKTVSRIFPCKYYKNIVPNFNPEDVAKINKIFKYVININTVKSSKTMFSSRIYESLATGNVVISNYSKHVFEKFPMIKEKVEKVSEEEILTGISIAMKNTYFNRMEEILEICEIEKIQKVKFKYAIFEKSQISKNDWEKNDFIIINEQKSSNELIKRMLEAYKYVDVDIVVNKNISDYCEYFSEEETYILNTKNISFQKWKNGKIIKYKIYSI